MPRSKSFAELVQTLPTEGRIKRAKHVAEALSQRIDLPIALEEANSIIGYSDTLAKQVPTSFAGHAFRDFSDAMFRYQIVQVLSLWDKPDPDAERSTYSLLTIAELVDDQDVIGTLKQVAYDDYANMTSRILNLPKDSQLRKEVLRLDREHSLSLAIQHAHKCETDLRSAIEDVRDTVESDYFMKLKVFRDHSAHALSQTRLEKKADRPVVMKYGYEKELLGTTIDLVEKFYCWVNGVSYDIEGSVRQFARKCAQELWLNCKFDIPDYS